ncbi:hypothetical protein [Legionella israelensis]|uniref:Coiled-coil protein n=1 Tax=Legionella israelensis TaxID=454 RepID=A0A0W0VEX3_9GAMM|nr:hypothetical protein [Legionella israelensis]KTD18672.1 hypothetical protein Lisr_2121 [Legionella israelensis]QBS08994.1 hypothetical protein E4T55_03450 [Legionella israelensis]SCY35877.1 hypothetical protein SAMN02746069_02173 [Legionella israelensis DSM 19235]STX58692.1 Uncharacterised protein [Legionella israelensis]
MPKTFFSHRPTEEGYEVVRKRVEKELEAVRKQMKCTKEERMLYSQESNSGDSADRAGCFMALEQLRAREGELEKSEAKLEAELIELLKEGKEASQKNDFFI